MASGVILLRHYVLSTDTVRELVNKSAASAASLDYVKFQAVIKSAASAASPAAEKIVKKCRKTCIFGSFL